MAVSKLAKNQQGDFLCPVCNNILEFSDGGQVRIVAGQVDYENVKPRYICHRCKSYYRELLNTGYYDVFDLLEGSPEEKTEPREAPPVIALVKNVQGKYTCPACDRPMEFSDGGQVRIVAGQVDYENVKPRYICRACKIFYRELLSSGLYERFALEEGEEEQVKKQLATGDIAPVKLSGLDCSCPRCGEGLKYVEAGAVKIVDGRVDMSDTFAHYICEECSSVYRPIAGTDYFQWHER